MRLLDRASETTTKSGTGATIALDGASAGALTFAVSGALLTPALAEDDVVPYVVETADRLTFEAGLAQWKTAPNRLERTTVLATSAGDTNPVDFPAGTHRVFCGLPSAAILPVGSTAGTVAAGDDARLSDARTPLAHTHVVSDLVSIAGNRLVGRHAGGSGAGQEVTVGNGLEFQGSGIRRQALTGDVTAAAGSNSTTIANDAVTTAKILDKAVTFAKIQDLATPGVVGLPAGAAPGPAQVLTAEEQAGTLGPARAPGLWIPSSSTHQGVPGEWLLPSATTVSQAIGGDNRQFVMPFTLSRAIRLREIVISVSGAAAAGGRCELTLHHAIVAAGGFDVGGYVRGALIQSFGEVETDSTGLKSIAIDEVLTPGRKYAFGAAFSLACSCHFWALTCPGMRSLNLPSTRHRLITHAYYTGAYPAPAGAAAAPPELDFANNNPLGGLRNPVFALWDDV